MNTNELHDDQLIFIREMLSDLSRIANAEGYRMLSHLIGMACLEAWEMECKRIGSQYALRFPRSGVSFSISELPLWGGIFGQPTPW